MKYLQVTEDSVTDSTPLFGTPSLDGDTLNFNPVGFGASSSGGSTPDATDGNLAFTVEAKPNKYIQELIFSELGDYTIFGWGTVATAATVSAPVYIDIVEVDGASIDPITLVLQMTFSPSGGTFNLIDDAGFGVSWDGSLSVDLTQALIDESQPFVGGVTAVDVDLDNILTAVSETSSSASIAKKDVKGFSVTAVIPEPSTGLLLGLGLVGLAARPLAGTSNSQPRDRAAEALWGGLPGSRAVAMPCSPSWESVPPSRPGATPRAPRLRERVDGSRYALGSSWTPCTSRAPERAAPRELPDGGSRGPPGSARGAPQPLPCVRGRSGGRARSGDPASTRAYTAAPRERTM